MRDRSVVIGDRRVTSMTVPAPVAESMREHVLATMSQSHYLLNDLKSGEDWLSALSIATREEIEASRMQLAFLSRTLASEMFSRWFNFSYSGKDQNRALIQIDRKHRRRGNDETSREDAIEVAQRLFDAVLVDCKDLVETLRPNPMLLYKAQELDESLAFLFEGKEFFRFLADARGTDEAKQRYDQNAARAEQAFAEVAAFVAGLGQNYSTTAAAISSKQMLSADAEARLSAGTPAPERLSRQDIVELGEMAGMYDVLWTVTHQPERRDEMIKNGLHKPLSSERAEAIREQAMKVVRINNDVFARRGFVATLRQVAACARDRADEQAEIVDAELEAQARFAKRYIRDNDAEHQQRIEEALERVPDDRRRAKSWSDQNMAIALSVDAMLESVDRVIRPDIERTRTLSVSKEGENWIGRISNSDDVLVVYPDPDVGSRDSSVLAVLMTSQDAINLPSIDVVKSHEWRDGLGRLIGTNFKSINEMFSVFENDGERSNFFDYPVRFGMPDAAPPRERWQDMAAAVDLDAVKPGDMLVSANSEHTCIALVTAVDDQHIDVDVFNGRYHNRFERETGLSVKMSSTNMPTSQIIHAGPLPTNQVERFHGAMAHMEDDCSKEGFRRSGGDVIYTEILAELGIPTEGAAFPEDRPNIEWQQGRFPAY